MQFLFELAKEMINFILFLVYYNIRKELKKKVYITEKMKKSFKCKNSLLESLFLL
jgi:hypothetical protein